MIPVINKIDAQAAEVERAEQEILSLDAEFANGPILKFQLKQV